MQQGHKREIETRANKGKDVRGNAGALRVAERSVYVHMYTFVERTDAERRCVAKREKDEVVVRLQSLYSLLAFVRVMWGLPR